MNVDILWAIPFKIKVKFTLLSVLACCGDCDWMPGLSSWLTGQQPIVICNVLSVCMSIVATIALLNHPWKEESPTQRSFPSLLSALRL